MNNPEYKDEPQAREMLESALAPGERLQAYTSGAITVVYLSKTYYIGLTMDRLMLVPFKRDKKTGPTLSIWRENIQSLKWSGLGGRLRVKFGIDELQIMLRTRHWRRRGKELAETQTHLPRPGLPRESEEMKNRIIQQAQAYHDLGFLRAANAEIEKLQRDPTYAADPETQQITQQFAEERLAIRVGAGFLFINVAITASLMGLFTLCGSLSEAPATLLLVLPAILDVLIGINLWKWTSRQWQGWAILRAVLGFVFVGIALLGQGQTIDFIIQTSYCAAIFIVLTGESSRKRTWLAIGLYTIGYLGVFVATFIMSVISGIVQGL